MSSLFIKLGEALVGLFTASSEAKAKRNAEQVSLRKDELADAPRSFLRLWISALGWFITFFLMWELVVRDIVIYVYFPELFEKLPPSQLDHILVLLMGMLGLS